MLIIPIITRLFNRGTDETIVRRAPRNKVYHVTGIWGFLQTDNIGNTVYILNRHLKAGSNPVIGSVGTNITPFLLGTIPSGASTATSLGFFIGPISVRTKYISVGYANANTIVWGAIIYGDIVTETKSNLIWEFITKRHR